MEATRTQRQRLRRRQQRTHTGDRPSSSCLGTVAPSLAPSAAGRARSPEHPPLVIKRPPRPIYAFEIHAAAGWVSSGWPIPDNYIPTRWVTTSWHCPLHRQPSSPAGWIRGYFSRVPVSNCAPYRGTCIADIYVGRTLTGYSRNILSLYVAQPLTATRKLLPFLATGFIKVARGEDGSS